MIRANQPRRSPAPIHAALALVLLLAGCGSQSPQAADSQAMPASVSSNPAPAPPPAEAGGNGPPEMTFSHTSHDFGVVSDTRDYTHIFDFVNTGGSVLDIQSVTTSCGCTTARAMAESIAPGERGDIEVTYDPRGSGARSYRITVVSNTETPGQVEIRAEIDPLVVIEPGRLELGAMVLHERHTELVTVLSRDPDMTVESVRVNLPHLTAEILGNDPEAGTPATPERSGRSVIRFVIGEEAPWGELGTTCLINVKGKVAGSDEPIAHTAYLPVSASLFGQLHAEPAMFRLGVMKPGEAFERSVRLYRMSSEPFEVREVAIARSNIPGIDVRAEPADEAGLPGYRIVLAADLGDYLGPVHGSVSVLTDVADEGQNEISFSGIVRSPG